MVIKGPKIVEHILNKEFTELSNKYTTFNIFCACKIFIKEISLYDPQFEKGYKGFETDYCKHMSAIIVDSKEYIKEQK